MKNKGIFTDGETEGPTIIVGAGSALKYTPPQPLVLRNDRPWGVDIDDTLLLWDAPKEGPMVTFIEPHSGDEITVPINENNIRLLKEKKARGCSIVLWTQGGYEYANAVATALNIRGHVDLIMGKPEGIIDDLEASAWMPKAVNIPYTKNYKK